MGERMEVEVVCPDCGGTGCAMCALAGALLAEVPESSLTAARLRLADAAEAMDKASRASTECHTVFGTEEECAAFYAKVGYTEAEALAVEQECYAACAEYNAALAALRTKRAGG